MPPTPTTRRPDASPLRLAMIGGGHGAFIGAVHRMAATLDASFQLVAGALSSDPRRAVESALALGLSPERAYESWEALVRGESSRDDRADAVAIVTPNASHFEIARALLGAGFAVVCDKPMVVSSAQAAALVDAVDKAGAIFAVTYNYTGYPMVRQARAMVRSGELGAIRKVFIEYHQGWLAGALEATGQKQASWRTDPALAGPGGAVGDIGTHAENLCSFVTGLAIESLCADATTFVPGRRLDDDASVLLRFRGGARGVLTASQVCVGRENALSIRVHADKGSIRWDQEEPNRLLAWDASGAMRVITRAGPGAAGDAAGATRLPPGHPEGFIEAFANLYRGVAELIRAPREGRSPGALAALVPTVRDGARGVAFVERVVASRGQWVRFEGVP